MLSLLEKVTTGTTVTTNNRFCIIYLKYYSSRLSCWSMWITSYIVGVIDISDIIHSLEHNKSSSISKLIKCKLSDL